MTRSTGNVFRDLGFSPDEAESLKVRADLMLNLQKAIGARKLKQGDAAELLGVSQPRVSDLMRGRIDLFSTETLIDMLAKLGVPAGGGVGPDQDIVAFSTLCTHMGGPLAGTYRGQYKVLGPCPFHLSTFDLIKHGMVVAGQATESLPQIVLEVKGDEIWATGVMGLIYGYHSNLAGGA